MGLSDEGNGMQVIIDSPMGALGRILDPNGPTIRMVQLSRVEIATLTKAVKILEALRETWGGDDNHSMDTDVALAMYVMLELVEDHAGRVEV